MCGSDSASLYLQVQKVEGQNIICEAKNGAVMDGLMTVCCPGSFAVCPGCVCCCVALW